MMRDGLVQWIDLIDVMPGQCVSVYSKLGREIADVIVTQVSNGVLFGYVKQPEQSGTESTVNAAYSPLLYNFALPATDERSDADVDTFVSLVSTQGIGNPEDEGGAMVMVIPESDESPVDKIDTSSLPKDVQKRLRVVSELDEDAKNRILSAISDSAMRAMRSVGVRETDAYARVVDIQKAVMTVLNAKQ